MRNQSCAKDLGPRPGITSMEAAAAVAVMFLLGKKAREERGNARETGDLGLGSSRDTDKMV